MKLIDNRSIRRAIRALRCLPFNSSFYFDAQNAGLSAEEVFNKIERYKLSGSKWFKYAHSVEDSFRWLIKIGVLRREVDGQGLTSKVRITPIGRQGLENSSDLFSQQTTLLKKLMTCLKYQLSIG